MASAALLPALALLVGALAGSADPTTVDLGAACVAAWVCAAAGLWLSRSRVALCFALSGYLLCGWALGAESAHRALAPPLRLALDEAFGGFRFSSLGPPGVHRPIHTRVRLTEDAAPRDGGVTLRAHVLDIRTGDVWRPAFGTVRLSVSGAIAARTAGEWRAGRVVEAPVTFRRPARYLNAGVADLERAAAFHGTALNGSIKSALLVEVIARGGWFDERAAAIRARVRRAVDGTVGRTGPVNAAIVTAILIGDRTGLPADVRERLQAAGTYHVIAISGGNVAILAAGIWWMLALTGAGGRVRAGVTIVVLAAYAATVTGSPSVWRATVTATIYLAARLVDHRSPPWNTIGVSLAVVVCVTPLDARDVGFALTFGATGALIETARWLGAGTFGRGPWGWAPATVAASAAVELALLPVTASVFSRVTFAGIILNLVALPLMTVTQVSGMLVVVAADVASLALPAAWLASVSTQVLLDSARLVELAPWLSPSVGRPPVATVVCYYAALAGSRLCAGRWRVLAGAAFVLCLATIITGRAYPASPAFPGDVVLTSFDVGQGDATLVSFPDGSELLVDTGGIGRGTATFDIGSRALAPALRAVGVRRLRVLALTHGDPDHIGGAPGLLRHLVPSELWEGVPVVGHAAGEAVRALARGQGAEVVEIRAGWERTFGQARVRALSPPAVDWDRPRVRNDDSVVLEIRYGDVAILLTGDAGRDVERRILSQLSPARQRILKVGHHGSATSTSAELLAAWPPDIAVISCGRGNAFGHPAPDVLERLARSGATILRTDRQGQIQVWTDGRAVHYRTFTSPASRRLVRPGG